MGDTIAYRLLEDGDFEGLSALFGEVFGRAPAPGLLRAKYDTAYAGLGRVSHIAWAEGRPVAFAGALPMPCARGGERLLGVQFCDYMTLPAFRRMGIHTRLGELNLAAAEAEGAAFVFAMHSAESRLGDAKLAWLEQRPMRAFELPCPRNALQRGMGRLPGLEGRILRALQPFALSPEAWRNSAPEEGLRVAYGPDFFAYKQFERKALLRMEGVDFWLKPGRSVRIGDVRWEEGAGLAAALERLRVVLGKLGVERIWLQAMAGTPLDALLSGRGWAGVAGFSPAVMSFGERVGEVLAEKGLWLNLGDYDTF